MKRKSLTPLGETEMEVLHHVWELQRASVADVRARVLESRDIAYTTVMTVLKNLADKGYLTFEKEGNSYIYSAARDADEVQHNLLQGLLRKVFKGSPAALVQTLVKYENLDDQEREEIQSIIARLDDETDKA